MVGAAERGRRGRGRPGGRPQQPGQERAVRQRPELGPDPGRRRHHHRRVRARRARRRDQRRLGVPGRRRGRGPLQGGPDRPATSPSRIDLHAGAADRHRSGPTTCRTRYVHENSAYSLVSARNASAAESRSRERKELFPLPKVTLVPRWTVADRGTSPRRRTRARPSPRQPRRAPAVMPVGRRSSWRRVQQAARRQAPGHARHAAKPNRRPRR